MRSKELKIFILIIFIIAIFAFPASTLHATTEKTILLYNVLGQGAFTLLKGVIQGKVKSFEDAGKCFLFGSLSGYGFFEAKRMVGKGKITGGIILANLSASISENVSRGDNPLSYFGYSFGPVRLYMATPFAKNNRGFLNLTVSSKEIVGLILSMKNSNKMQIRNGLITFQSNEPLGRNVLGWTSGIYPTTVNGAPDHIFCHEIVHVVQSIQTMSVSPEPFMSFKSTAPQEKKSFINYGGLNLSLFGTLNDLTLYGFVPYDRRWPEIEAYTFAKEDTSK